MILFGSGGHAKVILDILMRNGQQVEKILDDHPGVTELFGIPVYKTETSRQPESSAEAIIAIGHNAIRKKIAERFSLHYSMAVHPQSAVSPFSTLGAGTVVMAGAVVNPDTVIGRHCIINSGAVVEHDCVLEDFVHVAPNAAVAGGVKIGEGSHIGIGAAVIQGVTIGKWCTIGAGAVIIKDVPDGATVVGNPGKILKNSHYDTLLK